MMEKRPGSAFPTLFAGEALHGYMAYGSTSFPQVLGLASTWDPALVQQVFTAAGDEMASAGTNLGLYLPCSIWRAIRAGDGPEETYGERSLSGLANGGRGRRWSSRDIVEP